MITRIIILSLTLLAATGCSVSSYQAHQALNRLENIGDGKFESDAELTRYYDEIQLVRRAVNQKKYGKPACEAGEGLCLEAIVVTARRREANPEITNNQEAGVDEGDIVKVIGDYLVILRQGQLFSVRYSGDTLQAVDAISVLKPGWQHQAWIDELLVYQNQLVVIGYAYDGVIGEGTVELNILSLSDDGHFSHDNSYVIAAGDYFSSENYATRIVDGELIFNFPMALDDLFYQGSSGPLQFARMGLLPDSPEQPIRWQSLLTAQQIYKPRESSLHPVVQVFVKCPLASQLELCSAVGVITGQYEVTSYVTTQSIYLASQSLRQEFLIDAEFDYYIEDDPNTFVYDLYRIDLDSFSLTNQPINGTPINQFSFLEEGDRIHLLTRRDGSDDELSGIFLYNLARADFGNTDSQPPPVRVAGYHDDDWLNSRFVGDWLALGQANYSGGFLDSNSFVLTLHNIHKQQALELFTGHTSSRLEFVDDSLLVLGYDDQENLLGSIVSLDSNPRILSDFQFTGVMEDEYRSHAFNATRLLEGGALFGFTTRPSSSWQEADDYSEDAEAADLYFVAVDRHHRLSPAGAFHSQQAPEPVAEDCVVSCVDWYGNSRPFFLRGKVYGLSGYELIQGDFFQGEVRELQRIDYRLH
ncbi:beta-propeller domain-containing protein [Halioxenophilus sp. WMMB6]|uniref:beta-propeller domain-containing protein n=1 Tax=Halioxenophilus sp. WMMB6 TaxID=3073815 RepID=UPI00295EB16D|nr:beta-propeller domain-containing protein [Halioxenophilus sp. WMMB6]